MLKRKLLTASVSTGLTVAALSVAAQEASRIYDGRWQYETYCSTCHGGGGEGIYAFGVALKGNAFVANAPPAAIIQVIQEGRYNRARAYADYPGMPAFDYIRSAQAEALVAYMKGELQQ